MQVLFGNLMSGWAVVFVSRYVGDLGDLGGGGGGGENSRSTVGSQNAWVSFAGVGEPQEHVNVPKL